MWALVDVGWWSYGDLKRRNRLVEFICQLVPGLSRSVVRGATAACLRTHTRLRQHASEGEGDSVIVVRVPRQIAPLPGLYAAIQIDLWQGVGESAP